MVPEQLHSDTHERYDDWTPHSSSITCDNGPRHGQALNQSVRPGTMLNGKDAGDTVGERTHINTPSRTERHSTRMKRLDHTSAWTPQFTMRPCFFQSM